MTWFEDVAEKAKVDADLAEEILRSHGITGPRPVPARRRLRIEALHFAGVKNLESTDSSCLREFIPFSFTRAFHTQVTALVSDGHNSKGKSSILEILTWGLRGSARGVRSDVRKWLRQVCLLMTIADELILIAWRVTDGSPKGSIIALPTIGEQDLENWDAQARTAMNAHADLSRDQGQPSFDRDVPVDRLIGDLRARNALVIASFNGEDEMRQAVGDVMLNRLSIEQLTQWNMHRKATTVDDGGMVEHGWPLWSQALVISKPSHTSTIGETPTQASAVLGTFLATEWTSVRSLIRAQKRAVDSELAAIRRRIEADTQARAAGAEELRRVRDTLQEQLDALPPERLSADEAVRLLNAASMASARVKTAQAEWLSSALIRSAAEQGLKQARFDLAALREAAVTKRFWHSLKPSCCPRCDARVEQEQWEREQNGSCSLCNNPIDVLTTHDENKPSQDSEEDIDPLALAEERVFRSELEVSTTSAANDEAKAEFDSAEAEFKLANEAVELVQTDPTERRDLERRIGMLEGRIQERMEEPSAHDDKNLATQSQVLGAADKIAEAALTSDRNAALSVTSTRITELGKELGMTNLESTRLKGNAQLEVVRGGEKTNFGGLDDGARLRLKIALVVALIEIGAATGLGRHPGLLIVDSLAREELDEGDGERLLSELYRVGEQHGLQVVTGTTHSGLVDSVLPDEAVVRPLSSGYMW